jgi:hypothetical protein
VREFSSPDTIGNFSGFVVVWKRSGKTEFPHWDSLLAGIMTLTPITLATVVFIFTSIYDKSILR